MIFWTTSIKIKSILLKSSFQSIKSISNQYIQSSAYQEPIKSLSRAYQDFCSSIVTFFAHCMVVFSKTCKAEFCLLVFSKTCKAKARFCPCQNKYGLFQNLLVFLVLAYDLFQDHGAHGLFQSHPWVIFSIFLRIQAIQLHASSQKKMD